MSDECLMKQETAFPFYTQYQAVMWKFTLAIITESSHFSVKIVSIKGLEIAIKRHIKKKIIIEVMLIYFL